MKKMHQEEKINIARDKNTSARMLAMLAQTENPQVLKHVIQNRNTSTQTLQKIAMSEISSKISERHYKGVWISLAENPKTNAKTLDYIAKKLYDHPSHFALCGITENPKTPAKTLDYLSRKRENYNENEIAQNPNTSIKTLEYLAKKAEYSLAGALLKNKKLPSKIRKSFEASMAECKGAWLPQWVFVNEFAEDSTNS